MSDSSLHQLVIQSDLSRLRTLLDSVPSPDINAFDNTGRTPLMLAVSSTVANVEIVKLLLDHGADIYLASQAKTYSASRTTLAYALGAGHPEIVQLLVERGAYLSYGNQNGYDALNDAVHSRYLEKDERLIELLHFLIRHGVELNGVSTYGESGLSVLSHWGRFDAVRVLLEAGADAGHLQWTPLHHAVALGSLEEMITKVDEGADLESRDFWSRTPWLLALQTGDLAKAKLLYDRGADTGPAVAAANRPSSIPSRVITRRC